MSTTKNQVLPHSHVNGLHRWGIHMYVYFQTGDSGPYIIVQELMNLQFGMEISFLMVGIQNDNFG